MTQKTASIEVTQLLQLWQSGKKEALNGIFYQVYDEIRGLAHFQSRKYSSKNLLQTTGLVHEAFIRLAESKKIQLSDRKHFFALVSVMMCRIMVEKARERHTLKRGGDVLVELEKECDGAALPSNLDLETLLSLYNAIVLLERKNLRAARVMELKIFGEFENNEISEVMGISRATVKRAWNQAKQELFLSLTCPSANAHLDSSVQK